MITRPVLVLILLLSIFSNTALGSLGNSFPSYKTCVESCRKDICDTAGYYFVKKDVISWPLVLLWKCSDDCQYRCMWGVVSMFEQKGWSTPQFHGKWPFVRFLGIQEPASALFSLMNFALHFNMFYKYVQEFGTNCPMFNVWTIYAVISMNGWIWSTIFHSRETPFTELMDYMSALALVLAGAYAFGMRILIKSRRLYSLLFTAFCAILFTNHALYLSSGRFDYRYNLIANILIGLFSIIICLCFLMNNRSLPHCKNLAFAVLTVALSTYLEVIDFPPLFWVLDAHALWHLATFPAIYFCWRFVFEDSKYLIKKSPNY